MSNYRNRVHALIVIVRIDIIVRSLSLASKNVPDNFDRCDNEDLEWEICQNFLIFETDLYRYPKVT